MKEGKERQSKGREGRMEEGKRRKEGLKEGLKEGRKKE